MNLSFLSKYGVILFIKSINKISLITVLLRYLLLKIAILTTIKYNIHFFDFYSEYKNCYFINTLLLLKIYFCDILKINFISYYKKQNKECNYNFFINLFKSLNNSIIIFFVYLFFYIQNISTYFLFLYISSFYFLIFLFDILFIHLFNKYFLKKNTNIFICLFTLLEFYILNLFFRLNTLPLYLLSCILHVLIILSTLIHFCYKKFILLICKSTSIFCLFNVDLFFFPEILQSDFHITYRKIIFSYIFIRDIFSKLIYFLSIKRSLITNKIIMFMLSLCVYIIFIQIINNTEFNFINNISEECNSYIKKISIISKERIITVYFYIDLILYGINKMLTLNNKKNVIYKGYSITVLLLIIYSIISSIVKLLIYINLWPITNIFFTIMTIWHLTHFTITLLLLQFQY